MRKEYQLEKQFVGKVLIMTGIVCFILVIMLQGHFIVQSYPSVPETLGMWEDMYSPVSVYPPNDPADYGYMNKYKFENDPVYAWLRIYHYVWIGGGHIVDDEPVRVWYDENNKPVKVGYNIHYDQVEHTDFEIVFDEKYQTYRPKIWFASKYHTPSVYPISYSWEAFWRVGYLVIGIVLGIMFIVIGYLYVSSSYKEVRK